MAATADAVAATTATDAAAANITTRPTTNTTKL